jgi:Subtilase family
LLLKVLKVRIATATLPRERFESLAYFTSIGPTPDGRIKPDIVAPGTTISAHQCGAIYVPFIWLVTARPTVAILNAWLHGPGA